MSSCYCPCRNHNYNALAQAFSRIWAEIEMKVNKARARGGGSPLGPLGSPRANGSLDSGWIPAALEKQRTGGGGKSMAAYEGVSLGLRGGRRWRCKCARDGGRKNASVRATADERYSKETPPSVDPVHGAQLWPVRLDVRIKEGIDASESAWGSV